MDFLKQSYKADYCGIVPGRFSMASISSLSACLITVYLHIIVSEHVYKIIIQCHVIIFYMWTMWVYGWGRLFSCTHDICSISPFKRFKDLPHSSNIHHWFLTSYSTSYIHVNVTRWFQPAIRAYSPPADLSPGTGFWGST